MEHSIPREFIERFVVEFLGTALLTLVFTAVIFGNAVFPSAYQALYTPFAVGIILTVLVYLFKSFSGAHFNPAVSVGMWVMNKIHVPQLVVHLIAQFLGAYVGVVLMQVILSPTGWSIPFNSGSPAIIGEAIGAFILVFAYAAVTLKKVPESASGLIIGFALIAGATITIIPSGGILNPAIALASGALHISYLVSPLFGGVAAGLLAHWLYKEAHLA